MKWIITGLILLVLLPLVMQTKKPAHAMQINNSVQAPKEQKVTTAAKPTVTVPEATVQAPSPPPQPVPIQSQQTVSLSKQEIMTQAGISPSDFGYVDYIISSESGWRHTVWNTSGSGAYGLCQSLPASKMASAGVDYMNNPITQMKWCNSYAVSRYGGWQQAKAFWQSRHWW